MHVLLAGCLDRDADNKQRCPGRSSVFQIIRSSVILYVWSSRIQKTPSKQKVKADMKATMEVTTETKIKASVQQALKPVHDELASLSEKLAAEWKVRANLSTFLSHTFATGQYHCVYARNCHPLLS